MHWDGFSFLSFTFPLNRNKSGIDSSRAWRKSQKRAARMNKTGSTRLKTGRGTKRSKQLWIQCATCGSPFICCMSWLSHQLCFPVPHCGEALFHCTLSSFSQNCAWGKGSHVWYQIRASYQWNRAGRITPDCVNGCVTFFEPCEAYVANLIWADWEVWVPLQPKHSLYCFP